MIIIRDSLPEAVLIPYEEFVGKEEETEKLWKLRFQRLLKKGKKTFIRYLIKRKINPKKITEEEAYEIIKKA